MRYRDPSVLAVIAETMVPLVLAYQRGDQGLKDYYNQILNLMCRKLENFIVPRLSYKAYVKAKELGIPNLREMHWDDQPSRMKDPGRTIFHWEHVVPVESLRRGVLALQHPSAADISAVIARADIAWILKCENDLLDEKGYRVKRSDPMACYAACGIEFWIPEV